MKKHAYLIMAHNEPYILEKLILLLDDKRNDIYIHIDKKNKSINLDHLKTIVKYSNIYYTKRLDIRWGSYKQIKCEYLLLEEATKLQYQYYHFISGVDLPIKSQDDIHSFFDKNAGKEFIHYFKHQYIHDHRLERIKYYHLFTNNLRSSNKYLKILYQKLHSITLKIQKVFKVNRIKNKQFMYGANWFSITDSCARYVLTKKEDVLSNYKYTFCADEFFLQTIIKHSKFYDNLYKKIDDDYHQIMRLIDWNRGSPYTFNKNDFNDIMKSDMLFVRKLSTNDKKHKDLIDLIYNNIKGD